MSENTSTTQRPWRLEASDVVPILNKQKSSILIFLGTVLITALIGSLLLPKEYRATVLIHLLPRVGQEVQIQQVVEFDSSSFYEIKERGRTQLQIIKSRTVREQLGKDACWIEGNATPFGMYVKLYRYRDKFVVIDDVDSLYADRNGVRLLKCLCQTEPEKSLAWQSAASS